jgi:hypothetical protein
MAVKIVVEVARGVDRETLRLTGVAKELFSRRGLGR